MFKGCGLEWPEAVVMLTLMGELSFFLSMSGRVGSWLEIAFICFTMLGFVLALVHPAQLLAESLFPTQQLSHISKQIAKTESKLEGLKQERARVMAEQSMAEDENKTASDKVATTKPTWMTALVEHVDSFWLNHQLHGDSAPKVKETKETDKAALPQASSNKVLERFVAEDQDLLAKPKIQRRATLNSK